MSKKDPAYALACGIAIGCLVMIALAAIVQERRIEQAISRTEAPLISQVNNLEARLKRVTEQQVAAQTELVSVTRSLVVSENERKTQTLAAEGWKSFAYTIAVRWELAFIKYENDRRTARLDLAGEVELEWMEQNPPDRMAQTIRPSEARQLLGNDLIQESMHRLP